MLEWGYDHELWLLWATDLRQVCQLTIEVIHWYHGLENFHSDKIYPRGGCILWWIFKDLVINFSKGLRLDVLIISKQPSFLDLSIFFVFFSNIFSLNFPHQIWIIWFFSLTRWPYQWIAMMFISRIFLWLTCLREGCRHVLIYSIYFFWKAIFMTEKKELVIWCSCIYFSDYLFYAWM